MCFQLVAEFSFWLDEGPGPRYAVPGIFLMRFDVYFEGKTPATENFNPVAIISII
jgi:hypothetical protein